MILKHIAFLKCLRFRFALLFEFQHVVVPKLCVSVLLEAQWGIHLLVLQNPAFKQCKCDSGLRFNHSLGLGIAHGQFVNRLKTTPTPNKNVSYGIKGGGFVCHIFGSVCHICCRNPLMLREFYAIRTPIVWHIWGHTFCKYGGWWWSELFSICVQKSVCASLC